MEIQIINADTFGLKFQRGASNAALAGYSQWHTNGFKLPAMGRIEI